MTVATIFAMAKANGWKPKVAEPDETPVITEDDTPAAFADLYADRLRYDHTSARWHLWSGAHWKPELNRPWFAGGHFV